MIVRCIQIISPTSGEVVNDHPGIRVGVEYPVLEVITTASRVLIRIPERPDVLVERDSPGLWDAAMFTVVSGQLPDCWVAGLEDGQVTLAPKEWQRSGYWEDYFDGEPSAGADYERLRAEVLSQA
ncbi:hypothetical protein CG747_32780 [Streptomyces sp. CB02959]|uniref:hypothetical protein n=1 Tax=Streptomyces sp. CB02959 TaxID=2020330 RepID=UPI000C273965|nr:hypothetical protein [Streptomyces sp. CB02959]PJN36695.1 hypothetical protein CG747_32780 [Streptomyces sp. CB02959]